MGDQKHLLPITLGRLASHLNSLSNKDKVIKIVQYTAQAIQHYAFDDFKTDPRARRINTLFWSLVLHRKLFRYMNSLSDLVTIHRLVNQLKSHDSSETTTDKVDTALLLAKTCTFFVFWLLDNAVYLSMGKIVDFDGSSSAMLSFKLWLFANVINLIRNVRRYVKEKRDEKISGEEKSLVI